MRIIWSFLLTIFFTLFFTLPITHGHISKDKHEEKVILSDTGFIPEKIEIQKGTTVKWVIEGQNTHWPASNFHPTHEGYPEVGGCIGSKLDACRALIEGETYSFTFNKTGRWGIHDHNYSGLTMNIVVVDVSKEPVITPIKSTNIIEKLATFLGIKKLGPSSSETAKKTKANCSKEKNTFACYAGQMEKLAKLYGPDYSYKVLNELQKIDSTAKGCHFIAHGIGWGTYKKDPSSWQKALSQSSPACSYGAQMGIIEMYTQNLPDGKLAKKDIEGLCGKNPRADCNHAVGHMMLLETKNDLKKAIDLCEGINNPKQKQICFTGMYMERMIGSNLIEHGIIPKSMANWTQRLEQHKELCEISKGYLYSACWRELAHPAFYYFNKHPEKIFNFCDGASQKEAIRQCKDHSIVEIAGAQDYNLKALKKICDREEKNDQEFSKQCYLSLIGIKINFVGTEKAQDSVEYCTGLNKDLKKSCFVRIGAGLRQVAKRGEISKFCSNVPKEYRAACLGKRT